MLEHLFIYEGFGRASTVSLVFFMFGKAGFELILKWILLKLIGLRKLNFGALNGNYSGLKLGKL